MKKNIFIALLLAVAILALATRSFSADWSQYESGRDNIRLDGYQSQPGYVAFTDGAGTTKGYLFASGTHLYWLTSTAIDLTTTKLDPTLYRTQVRQVDNINTDTKE
jgi:hypothetical protein